MFIPREKRLPTPSINTGHFMSSGVRTAPSTMATRWWISNGSTAVKIPSNRTGLTVSKTRRDFVSSMAMAWFKGIFTKIDVQSIVRLLRCLRWLQIGQNVYIHSWAKIWELGKPQFCNTSWVLMDSSLIDKTTYLLAYRRDVCVPSKHHPTVWFPIKMIMMPAKKQALMIRVV